MKDRGMLLDESGDLAIQVVRKKGLIVSGLIVGDVTRQNRNLIIVTHPCEIKDSPTVGVGISSMLMSHDTLAYKHLIREQLEADGLHVSLLRLDINSNNQLDIQANVNYRG